MKMSDEELALKASKHIVEFWESIPKKVDDYCHMFGEHHRAHHEEMLRGGLGGEELYKASKAFLAQFEEQVELSDEINNEIIEEEAAKEPMTNSDDMTEFEIRVAMGSPRSGWTVDENALGYAKTSWLEQFRKTNKEVLVKIVDIPGPSKMLMCSHGIHRGDYCSECKGIIGEEE